jgi:hypothetical protein
MDGNGADEVLNRLQEPGGIFGSQWKDPTKVATTEWRADALESIVDPLVGPGVILVELSLNHPRPDFYGIVRIDQRGIWYSDADGSVQEAAWWLYLLPWPHVDELVLHQAS